MRTQFDLVETKEAVATETEKDKTIKILSNALNPAHCPGTE